MRLIGMDATVYSRTFAHDGFEASWNLLNGDATTRELKLNTGEFIEPLQCRTRFIESIQYCTQLIKSLQCCAQFVEPFQCRTQLDPCFQFCACFQQGIQQCCQ